MHKLMVNVCWCLGLILLAFVFAEQNKVPSVQVSTVTTEGWARNMINTTIFRHNSLVSHGQTQYIAFYNADSQAVLGKRRLPNGEWQLAVTPYKANVGDAHNSISIMTDGDGYLHMSWDHHNDPLRYCKSLEPGSLKMSTPLTMTGIKEHKVTYPEFYRFSDGDLLFVYRDGSSGNGNVMINYYDVETRTWAKRQDSFIDGENERNAYWQLTIDSRDVIHISWVWRESGDVATNHDVCYAKSLDRGFSWIRSDGSAYNLPITLETAEYACRIPQKSELINQTSMCTDSQGNPVIATYWRPQGTDVPQYHIVYHDGETWHTHQVSRRTTPFSLSGGGTKRIPVSRPQILIRETDQKREYFMLFRDSERRDRVSLAYSTELNGDWNIVDLNKESVGLAEPTYDTELWRNSGEMHIFVQKVEQGDGEKTVDIPPQPIRVLELDEISWK